MMSRVLEFVEVRKGVVSLIHSAAVCCCLVIAVRLRGFAAL